MECPTVRIKATTGSYPFTTINESDFDPAKHERYVEGAADDVEGAADDVDAPDVSRMNKAALLAHLTAQGIEHSDSMTKAELIGLLS